jgi:ligand-binding SRPBCC domain-containing protein
MARFETHQWVAVPLNKVFAFFSDPANLPRIMPPQMHVCTMRVALVPPPAEDSAGVLGLDRDKSAGAGSEFVISFRPVPFFPIRMEWHPHRGIRVGKMLQGRANSGSDAALETPPRLSFRETEWGGWDFD